MYGLKEGNGMSEVIKMKGRIGVFVRRLYVKVWNWLFSEKEVWVVMEWNGRVR